MSLAKGHREGAKCSELSRAPWNLLSNPPPTGHQDFGPTSESESGAAGNVGKGVVARCWDLWEDEGGQWIKEVGRCWWSCVAENLMVSQRTSRSERGRDLLEWHGEWGVEQALEANILSSCPGLFFSPFPWIPSLGTFLISYSIPPLIRYSWQKHLYIFKVCIAMIWYYGHIYIFFKSFFF